MSRDEDLLSMCRSGDPYTVLAEAIGGNHLRKAAKTLFLSYSYGMGEKGLGAWASNLLGITAEEGAQVAKSVVSQFTSVEKWKGSVFRTLEEKGRIGTRNGNFRYRLAGGKLLPKERRWAISPSGSRYWVTNSQARDSQSHLVGENPVATTNA